VAGNVTPNQEIEALKARLTEAEETLRAIHQGEVDALLVATPDGDRVFTLQGAERPYRLLIEAMNEGALTVTPDGTVLYCNSRLAEMAGRPMEQLIGSAWNALLPPHEHASFQALLDAAHPGGKGEFTLMAGNQTLVPVHVSIRAMSLDGVKAFAVLMTDISDLKAAEEALREANQELEVSAAKLREMVGELETFSYSIAHDMRAPLRAMQDFARLLLEDCGDHVGDLGRDYIHRIVSSATRLDQLIQDVLQYSQIVKSELKLEPLSVQKLVQQIIESCPAFQSPHAQIAIDGPLPTVLANRTALTQCISNLLGNAVKYIVPGTLPQIRIWSEPRNERVRLWVQDRGIGIEKEAQEHIFKMFQRLSDSYEGTGIGLAIVRKAVERMGGAAGVESEPGEGSRFWLELKAAHGPEPTSETAGG
jgi:PAS domain S-box-containing protein